jgi:tRNA nucleotidyltransferase (CCA-adding enzyme)
MDVILTHEQADFDAIAAVLGAHLMDEKAYPVVPRRVNRNVRSFLTLYGVEMPFVEARDLPYGSIHTVTLVDTQSLITLKGMSHHTKIQVVDHHTLRADLPGTWNISIDPVGACTTLFVEGLHEHNGQMSPIHATLLLLGIYEDTGALTYSGTTPRDIRAAAYLLEQGASLKILSRYLNPPLTDEQRQVYDRLLSTANRYSINGQNILIAQASAEDLNDEISAIAHKLRDLLDPDALFLIVRTPEGIRIVARSITDQVDVSKVTEHFGGGGHGRAAAALIRLMDTTDAQGLPAKKPTLNEVHEELLHILPEHVRPSYVVRQIMSPRPLVLAPDTPAEKAAHLMQRYGYEGYPVVENGKVRGLLTRRAVDRALSHKLNLPASSLMESGEVTVQPGDSTEHLRRVMIESNWGQIPVVDPATGAIIGIVTRTDLLKTAEFGPSPERQNLAARLEAALSPMRLALLLAVAEKAYEQHLAVYVVGGFVRDLLSNRPSPDFDVVVEGDAIALAKALSGTYGGRLVSHGRFGTSKWTIGEIRSQLAGAISHNGEPSPDDLPDSLDLISARTEFYDYPTALPTVERSSIKLDLHRRDFTINTMALRLDGRHYGELYDYWGGLRDLRRGLVRVLHSLSFIDDPTRMIRAVRFEQRFNFKIEDRTLQLISEARSLVRHVSGDRLRHELSLVFSEERVLSMLNRLQELDLLSSIHPALAWSVQYNELIDRALHGEIPPVWQLSEKIGNLTLRHALGFLVWLAQVPFEEGLNICERLRLPKEIREALESVRILQAELPELADSLPSKITQRLDGEPAVVLFLLDQLQPEEKLHEMLYHYLHTWRNIWPIIDGNDLRRMNLPTGPHYRYILTALRAAWLNGEIKTAADESHLLKNLLPPLPETT